jgi:3-hydroxyisobutyrate dehydrogenase-like beta-hydroxyacid dehydrogenase
MIIGWIGLGRMGRPMVENLVRKGFDVVVQNRGQDKVRELAAVGARAGGTFAEMAAAVDSIHTCLPDGAAVDEVMSGAHGIFEGAREGLIVVDHSTIRPVQARALAAEAAKRGASFIDAPVSGAGAVAERGELTIMAGGEQAAFDRVLPAFEAMSRNARLMGPAGSGSLTKLINGLMMTTTLAVSFEALTLASKAGIDTQALFEVIRTASGASRAWERNTPRVLSGEFGHDGAVFLLAKDEEITHELAESLGVVMPIFETARAFWRRAMAAGLGDEDISAGAKLFERESGVPLGPR